jgi:hypothetical protein
VQTPFSPSAEEKTRQYFKPKKQADSKAQNENDDVPQYPLPTAPHAVGNSIPIRPNARCCGVVSDASAPLRLASLPQVWVLR